MDSGKKRIEKLRNQVEHHRGLYHTHDTPEISDEAYDALVRELLDLEIKEGLSAESLTQKIGGTVIEKFKKVKHTTPQWSYDNVFNYDELVKWDEKLERFLVGVGYTGSRVYTAELKIDGLKIILTYKKGVLVQAATRGDGSVGEDITHNIIEVKSVPKKLTEKVDAIVVGEAWMQKSDLEKINVERAKNNEQLFANTRNAAAGSLRQLDANVTRRRNIQTFIYTIDKLEINGKNIHPNTQSGSLQWLKENGFSVNDKTKLLKSISEIEQYYQKYIPLRDNFEYGVDGVVIKFEDLVLSEKVGYTAKAPRFAIAYKFPAEEVTTIVEDIAVQVGRTGAITPVAHMRPVLVAGSTVARATLHNIDEIHRLGLKIGDTVILKKAGDVIPEIIRVLPELRSGKEKVFYMPKYCPECNKELIRKQLGSVPLDKGGSKGGFVGELSVAYYCPNKNCPAQILGQLIHFVSKKGLNIVGLGDRIIEKLLEENIISTALDIFKLKKSDLVNLEKFGDKSAENTIASIQKSRTTTLARLIYGLGISHVGEETAMLIANICNKPNDFLHLDVDSLVAVDGIGTTVADSVLDWLAEDANVELYKKLLSEITITEVVKSSSKLVGKTFVITGTLPTLSRDQAKQLIIDNGGKVSGSVSAKTSYVLAGTEPGTKYKDAQKLGVQIIDEVGLKGLLI